MRDQQHGDPWSEDQDRHGGSPRHGGTLGVRGGRAIAARVERIEGRRVVLAFTNSFLFDDIGQTDRRGASGLELLRMPAIRPIDIEMNGMTWPSNSIDISLFGLKVADRDGCLRPGREVSVRIGGIGRRNARVIWAEDGQAGLRFDYGLSYELLDDWLGRFSAAPCE